MQVWRLWTALVCGLAAAQTPADRAYEALRQRDYEAAVAHFREALTASPAAPVHKDMAYTLLRMGERAEALDHFEAALRMAPDDEPARLEFAFLCYELKRERDARRAFQRLRQSGDAAVARTAAEAFENVDRPMREAIARWQEAVARSPRQWTAHEELARWAAQRDELPLAERHYREALRLRPDHRPLRLELARTLRDSGKNREAIAWLLGLARGPEPRAAAHAQALLPDRYPYPYEFAEAIQLDPGNVELHREYAYLLLAMGRREHALREFREILARHPDDAQTLRQLEQTPALPAREMGRRSLEKSYMADAERYLRIALEEDPRDAESARRLGLTLNMLRRDEEALLWLDRAAKLGDTEARRAHAALRRDRARFRLSAWALPMSSSRFDDLFLYGQFRGEWKLGRVRPYISLRANGDVRGGATGPYGPVYLSEQAVIAASGIGLPWRHGVYLWAEAGQSFSRRTGSRPDYRGGVSWLRQWPLLSRGFQETTVDGVFVSRFGNDFLAYVQNRTGFRRRLESGFEAEAYVNWNVTAGLRGQPWANFLEAGPGVRVRWKGLPPGTSLRADFVRGAYTINRGNIQSPNFWDLRLSVWYAFSH